MNVEEILKTINDLIKIAPDKGSYAMSHKMWKQLLDYITNLQQENERLKIELASKPDIEWELETKDGQKFTIIQSKRIDMQETLNKSLEEMCKQKEDYKSRIEKAIEYIELWHYRNDYRVNSFTTGCKNELLNILQGVGKDE